MRGVTELVSLSIVGIVFLQLADTLYSGRFTRADVLLERLKRNRPVAAARLQATFHLTGAALMAVILWAAWTPLVESIRIREYVGAIGDFTAPVWPVRLIMLIGLAVTLLTFLFLAFADLRRARGLVHTARRLNMSAALIASLSLVAMLLLIWCGMHVAVVLATVSFIGVWLIKGNVEVAANLLAQGASDAVASHIFGVVPLFVLTGFLVAAADVGKDAFEVANQLFRRLRGGLGVATVAANAVFAAITGISIASAAVFTRVAVPQMQRFGYRSGFATGVVAGSSVLGMLIPPSLLMILYGFLSNQSVGDMFTAGIVPGLLLALSYAVGIVLLAYLRPGMVFVGGRALPVETEALMPVGELLVKLLPSVVMIVAVLGGLYGGLFTATEAGAVGAALALLIAVLKRKLNARSLWAVLTETGHVTVAVSFLIICASIYTRMLAMSGMPQFLVESMAAAGLGQVAFLLLYVAVVIALGTIIDSSSIMLIVLPLMLPIAQQFGMNLVWFGVITVVAVEIGLLTPPFGLSVFVIKSTLNDPSISLGDIFRGTAPFTLIMFIVLLVLMAFPQLSLVLLK